MAGRSGGFSLAVEEELMVDHSPEAGGRRINKPADGDGCA